MTEKREIESKSFIVSKFDGGTVEYVSNEETKYYWVIGPSGELLIFRKVLHSTFDVIIKEDRVRAHAHGTWDTVEIIDEDEIPIVVTPTIN